MALIDRYSGLIRLALKRFIACLAIILCGCTSGIRVQGTHYVHHWHQHEAKTRTVDQNTLIIYIEGDGIPWVDHGSRPADDPTPLHALAYELFKKTPYAAWYITRPCYDHVKDMACNPQVWTHARYSEQVVDSMASVINHAIAATPEATDKKVFLTGYSGGGALALLIAPRVPQVTGVITVAGNLDINAWTQLHGFEAMNGSLNPLDLNESGMKHIALIGDRDTNIPFSILGNYIASHSHTLIRHFAKYDHVCCWEKNWPALLDATLADMKD